MTPLLSVKNIYIKKLNHLFLINLFVLILQLVLIKKCNCKRLLMTQHNNHANISELLNNLLRGYDNSIRPDFGGSPTIVEVDIMVRSMGPISEVDMTYSMDCYFRQSWIDRRLAFKGGQDTLALSISMLAKIWKPDTYFYNGKQSYLHTITTPNKFVRLYQDGRVLYSSRLTIKAGCPMNLENFPMDVQRCPLKFGSFGYSTADVLYNWNKARQAVAIAEDMKLSQFDLVDCPAGNVTDIILNGGNFIIDKNGKKLQQNIQKSEFSMLLVSFHLQRHMGNFLIQVYGPCILLVVLSWVSFWLNREATADRVSLGITTVLTMTFLGLEARTDLPKVPYPTALDFFVFLSFGFIFATIIQFAVVHYFTKYGSGECYFSTEEFISDSDVDENLLSTDNERIIPEEHITIHNDTSTININNLRKKQQIEVIPLAACSIPIHNTTVTNKRLLKNTSWIFCPCLTKAQAEAQTATTMTANQRRISFLRQQSVHHEHIETPHVNLITNPQQPQQAQQQQQQQQQERHHQQQKMLRRPKRAPRFNSVSKIDRASRIVFPLLFLMINLFYWYSYLAKSERLDKLQ